MTKRLAVAVTLVTAVFGSSGARPLAAQSAASALLASARSHFDAARYVQAIPVLRLVVQPRSNATREERLEALVLLATSEFLTGQDSVARRTFREAFALDPVLEVEGLGALDPRLPQVLADAKAAARPGAVVARADTGRAPSAGTEELYECTPRCAGLDDVPRFVSMPRIVIPDGMGPIAQQLRVVAELVIDTAGRVEPESVRLTFLNARGVEGDIVRGIRQARFRPARVDGRPVRVHVELTFGPRYIRSTLLVGRPNDPS